MNKAPTMQEITDSMSVIEQHAEHANLLLTLLSFGAANMRTTLLLSDNINERIDSIVAGAAKNAAILSAINDKAVENADRFLGISESDEDGDGSRTIGGKQ